jgi:hypothetical protein
MSIARIGTRATVVGLGVLASLAFTAAPSWAGGGNSANAALCETYPGVLLAQDGSAFKNEGECTSYGAQGGQIVGVDAVSALLTPNIFSTTYSGFGLKPGTKVLTCDKYSPSGETFCSAPVVAADGTLSEERLFNCAFRGSRVAFLFVQATTASGTFFERRFPPPSGC